MADIKEFLDFGTDFAVELPEEQDDKFRIIPQSEYVPEWEEEVKRYMLISPNLPYNNIKYEHVQIPEDLDAKGFERWATEEIRRCREGHNGMPGKMYFYYNYCWIQKLGKKIRPEFRVIDNEWFKFIEACQKSNEWGIICVKRRRVGASWKEAADALHDCLFNSNFNVGMNSKTERDSGFLLQKVKFLYDSLPEFIRVPNSSNTQSYLKFTWFIDSEGKVYSKGGGNRKEVGNFSSIIVVPPTDTAYEGLMLSKWVCDEAGKVSNLATMWQYTEDCLMQETRRVGMPVIFGTAGDIGAEGKDLEYMWRNAHQYKLKKFFFSGWMGLNCDEFGNDDKENCIRWVVYGRKQREGLRIEELNTFIQKYPLTIPEAFTVTTSAGVGNIVKVKAQMQSLSDNPPVTQRGWFRMKGADEVEFVPDARGKCIVYEKPKTGVEDLYIGGCDPADHNDTFDEVSDLALFILRRQHGTSPAQIVFEYVDRPADVTEYYEQALMAALYYNKAKLLIEKNRYGMINFFEKSSFKFLLARTPQGVIRVHSGRATTYGATMTPANKEYMKQLLAKYIEDYYENIPSRELLEEFIYFGARNTDRAIAFGWALIYLEDYKTPAMELKKNIVRAPHFGYKNVNGVIKRVTYTIDEAKDRFPGYKAPRL